MALPGSASAAPAFCSGQGGDPAGPQFQFQPGEAKEAGWCSTQDGSPIHVAITQQGTNGTATVVDNDANQVRVLYTAGTGTAGMTDTIKFRGTSSGGEAGNEVTMNTNNVANTDDVPVCQPGDPTNSYVTGVAETAGSCSDPDAGDVLDVTITQQGTKGTAVVVDDNTDHPHVEYTAASTGSDTFKFQATDGSDPKSNLVTTSTQNVPAPAPPRAPECHIFTNLNTHLGSSTLVGTCADLDSPPAVHVTITAPPTRGVASIIGNDTHQASLNYKPTAIGADQFKVVASANGLQSPVYTVNTFTYSDSEPGENDGGEEFNPEKGQGGSSAGTVTVGKNGSFTLKRKVDCTGAGPNCKVANALSAKVASSAKKKNVKLGGSKFTVKAGKKGANKLKLTKKGLKLLKRKGKIKAKIKTTVRRGKSVTTKTVSITLKKK